jgi:hypothetical protein
MPLSALMPEPVRMINFLGMGCNKMDGSADLNLIYW